MGALRAGHGKGAGTPHIEVPPFDELARGVAVAVPRAEAMPRPPYAAGSAEAREAGRRGGKTKAGTTALAAGLGLEKTFSDPGLERYRNGAENFARLHVRRLAQTVGGGECGPGPASIVWSAGLQLAASRWAFEVKGDPALASRLANDSRQNLLAAHELCAREAEARRAAGIDSNPAPWFTDAPATPSDAERSDVETTTATSDNVDASTRRLEAATTNYERSDDGADDGD